MKAKFFLIGVLLLSIFAFSVPVNAIAEYSIGVSEGDNYKWEIVYWDKDLADDYLGTADIEDELGDGAKVGAKSAVQIEKIEEADDLTSLRNGEDTNGWKVETLVWDWTTNEADLEKEDKADKGSYELFAEPEEMGKDIGEDNTAGKNLLQTVLTSLLSGVPSPTIEYLSKMDWHSDTKDYLEIDATKILYKIKDPDTDEYVYYEYVWDSNRGMLTKRKCMEGDELNVIFEVIAVGGIPGYELPIFLSIMSVCTLGMIYIIMKKK
ncbi:MAG: hypothetical protein ACTSR8_06360 [Promethearchaeota archaeon]